MSLPDRWWRIAVVLAGVLGFMAVGLPARAQDALVRSFTAGTGPEAVGIAVGEDSDDEEPNGPQALYADAKGQVYLLDQLNGRVLQFDPAQPRAATRSLKLPDAIQPSDLLVRKDVIYAWDGQVHALQPDGPDSAATRSLSVTRSVAAPDEATVAAFAQMGTGAADTADDPADLLTGPTRSLGDPKARVRRHADIETHGRGLLSVDTIPVDASSVQLDVKPSDGRAGAARLRVKVRSQLGSVEFLEVDRRGRMYVLAENIPGTMTEQSAAYVARYTPAGLLEGIYELPLAATAMVSRRFVAVSPDGDVYFLRNRKGSVDVLGIGFRALRNTGIIDAGIAQASPGLSVPQMTGASAAVGPLSRQRILQTAFAFEALTWQVNAGAYGRDPDQSCSGYQRIRRPWYIEGRLNQQVRGVPYCWGCMGSLPQFAARVQKGMLAGNVCTRNNPRNDTAGVDCSAFVSAAWGLSTHFTTIAIPAIARRLSSPWDLQPGDALDKPGSHVMLFLRFTPDRRAEVMESSTGGCNGRVCRNVYPLSSLLARGYQPMRYKALADGTAQAGQ